MSVTIAAIQMCSGTDPVRNVETMRRLVREAAGKGASYIQTPEMTGALQRDRAGLRAILRQEADDPVVTAAAGDERGRGEQHEQGTDGDGARTRARAAAHG